MDWSVGKILDQIDRLGIHEDTLVIFISDNGPWIDAPIPVDEPGPWRWAWGSAAPLAGSKGSAYEGGVCTPFIARWPGQLPANTVWEEPVLVYDIAPTLASLACQCR